MAAGPTHDDDRTLIPSVSGHRSATASPAPPVWCAEMLYGSGGKTCHLNHAKGSCLCQQCCLVVVAMPVRYFYSGSGQLCLPNCSISI